MKIFVASNGSAVLKNPALTGSFLICEGFPTKMGVLLLPEVEKFQL